MTSNSPAAAILQICLKGAMSRAKVYCGNKLFTLVFYHLGTNVLSPNVTTPDTIVSVISVKKTYYNAT